MGFVPTFGHCCVGPAGATTGPTMAAFLRCRLTPTIALPALLGLAACTSCGKRANSPTPQDTAAHKPPAAPRHELHIFAFGRVKGHIAPCGCTTEPLGGLAYAFGYIEGTSTPESRLVLEPGSFLYPDPAGPDAPDGPADDAGWEQAQQRASILHARFSALGEALVSGLGPLDLTSPTTSGALNKYPLLRVLANSKSPGAGAPFRLTRIKAGQRQVVVGITGVTDPSVPQANKLGPLTNPVPAVQRQIKKMRDAGAEITIALVHGTRDRVETIARETEGLDFAVVGYIESTQRQRLGTPVAKVGDTFILEPGEQLQTISHVTLSLAPDATLAGTASWELREPRSSLAEEIQRLEARLEQFERDPSADVNFLDRLRVERDHLKTRMNGSDEATGPVALTVDQVKVTCHREVDARSTKALKRYDGWVARENAKRFAGVKAPPVKRGQSGYAGTEECEMCHDEATAFWNDTVHASAYQTLVDANKQFDLNCVGCHVTGFRRPGGSEVVENQGLTSIQCESCHGPGQVHADDPEKAGRAQSIAREVAVDVCLSCHTPEHSDTFDYEAYLRDILGPHHGEEARKALGDGPTGKELRAAGLAKAGGSCQKM